jgi:hypothetical protein
VKKFLRIIAMCFLISFIFLILDYKEVSANTNEYSTLITLDNRTKQEAFSFSMPKNGKIKLNIDVKDKDTVPGILTFAIQKDHSKNSEKTKEITGITSTNGVKDLEIELAEGLYYFYYELTSASGDLSDTTLGLNCIAEILPSIGNNISELSVHSINSFDDITKDGYEEINFGDEAEQIDLVLPFTVDAAGGILIFLKQENYSKDLEAGIYQDLECTRPVGDGFLLDAFDDSADAEIAIPKKGTYYVKFTYNKYSYSYGIKTYKVKIYSISGEDRTLSDGKATVAYQVSDKDKIIYKFNIKDTKLLGFRIVPYDNSSGASAYFRLLDKHKKQLTGKSYVASLQNIESKYDPIDKYYTVDKGTYYLEVDVSCSIYKLESKVFDVNKQAGSSKSKAKVLKNKGSAAEGYFTVSDKTSKADWYKFSATSSRQYINFTIGYIHDGDIIFQILNSKGEILYDASEETGYEEGSYYHWVEKSYSKGTYYVKVFKGSKNSSCVYTVVLKKII